MTQHLLTVKLKFNSLTFIEKLMTDLIEYTCTHIHMYTAVTEWALFFGKEEKQMVFESFKAVTSGNKVLVHVC